MNIRGEVGGVEWAAIIELPWATITWGKPTSHRMRLESKKKGHDLSMAEAEEQVRDAVPQILADQGLLTDAPKPKGKRRAEAQ